MISLLLLRPAPASALQEEAKGAPPPIDSDSSPPLSFQFGPAVSLGARLDLAALRRKNRDLREAREDDQTRLTGRLDLAALIRPLENVELFSEFRFEERSLSRDGEGEVSRDRTGEVSKAYLLWKEVFPATQIQIGRQRFKDSREWIYDENLDAVRLIWGGDPIELQLSVGSNVVNPKKPEDRIRNYLFYALYQVAPKDEAAFYAIARRDPTKEDYHPTFIGISWKGKSMKDQRYWLEAASLSGSDGSKILRGYGWDIGWSSRFDYPMKPSVTVGYAFGSGDRNTEDRIDQNFQQTGLQDNQGKWHGVTKFKYYGELFDPELSNLKIWTVGLGATPLRKVSVDLVYHRYAQVEKAGRLRDAGIKARPSGDEKNLGSEIDLIWGFRAMAQVQMEATSALFLPGSAFPGGARAFLQEFKMQILF